jgi:hypothetical protein
MVTAASIARGGPLRLRPAATLLLLALLALTLVQGYPAPPAPRPLPDRLDWGRLPLAFTPNAGQADPAVQFTAHDGAGTFAFTASGVHMALPATTAAAGRITPEAGPAATGPEQYHPVRLDFLGANPAGAVMGAGVLPGKVNYLRGNDPARWRTGLPTYENIVYQALYPGVDLRYEGSQGRLKGTYTVAPAADPGQIRWRYAGAREVVVDALGNLRITFVTPGVPLILTEHAPVAWQERGPERVAVPARYAVGPDGSIGFVLGGYDPAYPLIIDPALSYSTYLGGARTDQIWGIAVDAAGSAYVTGYTNSENFPTEGAVQWFRRGTHDGFVTKLSPDGSAVVYSTFFGGDHLDSAHDIAVGPDGSAYITGATRSTDFPTVGAFQPNFGGVDDSFVARLSPDGASLLYSTYLGGTDQENRTYLGLPGGIAVDAVGNAYVTGDTLSNNFPVLNPFQPARAGGGDAFLAKFGPSGTLLYSTFLGGEGYDSGKAVKADAQGNAYLTGYTGSQQFPVQNAFQWSCRTSAGSCHDMFVTKLAPSGAALVFSTYIGGNDLYWVDMGTDLALDAAGNAYVTGWTGSTDFPVLTPYQSSLQGHIDAAIFKFDPTGLLLYSTYFGGVGTEVGYGITAGPDGSIYAAGLTTSNNMPLMDPLQNSLQGNEDAFVARFSPDGQQLRFATYFGGSNGNEEWGAMGIALDPAGDMYIAGHSEATNFPLRNPFQATNRGFYDGFVAKIAAGSPTPTATGTPPTASPTRTPLTANYIITAENGGVIEPGITDTGNHCNNCYTWVNLPFPVRFYEQQYDRITVSSNGTIGFNFAEYSYISGCLPEDLTTRVLLPNWDDLYTNSAGSGIYTSVTGQAPHRAFNIEWRASVVGGARVHFEARLFENSPNFEVIYGEVAGGGYLSVVGIQTDFGARYTQYSCNTASLYPGLKLNFTFQGGAITVTPGPTRTATHYASPAPTGTAVPSATRAATGTAVASPPAATPTACPIQFTDVDPNHPFYPFIRCLACRGIVSGYGDGTFRPYADVTRGQLAKILASAAGLTNTIPSTQQTFADTPATNPFWLWIERLAGRGAIAGYGCGGAGEPCDPQNRPYFRPYANATRGQISKITAVTAGYNGPIPTTQQTFADVPPSNPFWRWIEELAGRGIVNGYACGGPGDPCDPLGRPYFRWGANTTRGQMAKVAASTFFPNCRTPGE